MNFSSALQADVFNKTPVKVILFDGTKRQWVIWMEKFTARAARKGYKELLEEGTYKGYEILQDDVSPDVSIDNSSEQHFDAGDGVESSEEAKFKDKQKVGEATKLTENIPRDEASRAKIEKDTRQLNAMAYTDLVLSMDMSKASGMIAFNLVRKTRSKKCKDGNVFLVGMEELDCEVGSKGQEVV